MKIIITNDKTKFTMLDSNEDVIMSSTTAGSTVTMDLKALIKEGASIGLMVEELMTSMMVKACMPDLDESDN